MTDNLRARIAAVICDMDALHAEQWSLDVADAVIREVLNRPVTDIHQLRIEYAREVS